MRIHVAHPCPRALPALAALALAGAALVAGCSGEARRAGPEPESASVGEVVLGQVKQVDRRYGFVVIELLARAQELAPGDTLEIRREGRAAVSLRISPQATRRFVVADVVSGEPEVGDDVYRSEPAGREDTAAVPQDQDAER